MADPRALLAEAVVVLAVAACSLVTPGCGDDEAASAGETTGDDSSESTGDTTSGESTSGESTSDSSEASASDTDATTSGMMTTTSGDPSGDPSESGDEPVDGFFVAVGDGGRRARSVDGLTWTDAIGSGLLDENSPEAAEDALRALTFTDGVVIAVGGGGNFWEGRPMIMRSEDLGATWDEDLLADGIEGATPRQLYGVAASAGIVVAAGLRGTILRSPDRGLTWTSHSHSDGNARLLAVAGTGETFVVAGWTDTGYDTPKTSFLLGSGDGGETWEGPYKGAPAVDDLAAGNGIFIAVGSAHCQRSDDGLEWSPCDLPEGASAAIQAVEFIRGEFLVIHGQGVAASTDGISWKVAAMPPLGTPTHLAYGAGRFVGVRWTERGWSEDLLDWEFSHHAAAPLRGLIYATAE